MPDTRAVSPSGICHTVTEDGVTTCGKDPAGWVLVCSTCASRFVQCKQCAGTVVYPPRLKPPAHCVHGHELTEENTVTWAGRRACRQCAAVYRERGQAREKKRR